jgi:hypothetical protein
MSIPMTGQELGHILEKLRSEYKDLSLRFGTANFDYAAFERRLSRAPRGSLQTFLLAEVGFLEELKDQTEKKLVRKMELDRALEMVASKLSENWANHPKLDFHPAADIETRHFYGAMNNFHDGPMAVLRQYFQGTVESLEFERLFHRVEQFGRRNGQEAPRFRQLNAILQIERGKAEREKQKIMRESAQALYDLACRLEKFILQSDYQVPACSLDPSLIRWEDQGQHWSELDPLQLFQKIIACALTVIEDFRLSEFARSGQNKQGFG